jgi:hypothetical protein
MSITLDPTGEVENFGGISVVCCATNALVSLPYVWYVCLESTNTIVDIFDCVEDALVVAAFERAKIAAFERAIIASKRMS